MKLSILTYFALISCHSLAETLPQNEQVNYLQKVKESSEDMLVTATAKYKAGTITKEQYIQVALSVSSMIEYNKKSKSGLSETPQTNASASFKGPTISTPNPAEDNKVLIGTANNGVDKIYSIKQNSWDTKYGYKVTIVPGDPLKQPYDLTIPSSDPSRTRQTDASTILANIPANFNVDKAPDNKPIVKYDEKLQVGMWTQVAGSEVLECANTLVMGQSYSGSCKIGEKGKYSQGGHLNELIPAQKKCIDKGFKYFVNSISYSCEPDFYLNKNGQ